MKPPPGSIPQSPSPGPHGNRKWNGIWRKARTYIQDHPAPLMAAWGVHEVVLRALRRPFERVGVDRASRWTKPIEEVVKKPLFDCRMCGQCILHFTGMTCPMTCPKQIRNGPCGGVRMDGNCEVHPEMPCVWVQAVERSARMTGGTVEIQRLNPPVDWQLQNTASWVTFAVERDQVTTGSGAGPHYASEVTSR